MRKPKTVAAVRKAANKQARAKAKVSVKTKVPIRTVAEEYMYVNLRLPKPVFNVLARAAEIAGMEHEEVSLALIALAIAQRELASQ
jgi:hypothetical protein